MDKLANINKAQKERNIRSSWVLNWLKSIQVKIHYIFRNSKKEETALTSNITTPKDIEVTLVLTTEKTAAVQSTRKINTRAKKTSCGSTVTISFLIIAVLFLIICLGITYFRHRYWLKTPNEYPLQTSDEQNIWLLQLIKIEENQ